ncbi:hypothetical protein ACH6CV_05840, partial [Bacillota bacterium Meth-B3]
RWISLRSLCEYVRFTSPEWVSTSIAAFRSEITYNERATGKPKPNGSILLRFLLYWSAIIYEMQAIMLYETSRQTIAVFSYWNLHCHDPMLGSG